MKFWWCYNRNMEKFLKILEIIWNKIAGVYNKAAFVVWIFVVLFILVMVFFVSPQARDQFFNGLTQNLQNLSQQVSGSPTQVVSTTTSIPSPSTTMNITSSAFQNNGNIPSQYTCDGQGMSPPLQISDVPAEAKTLALIVHDPDAPRAGGFTHWVMWNIPASTTEIPENTVPQGAVQGHNGAGNSRWTGPCPPSGIHHYQFMLYALDAELNLPETTDKDALEKAMQPHAIAQTTLVGLYQKQ